MIRRFAIPLLALMGLVAIPAEAPSCSKIFPEPVFMFQRFPLDGSGYAQGNLGVLEPTFEAKYYVIAYRYLIGVPLTRDEIEGTKRPGRPKPEEGLLPWISRSVEGVSPDDMPVYRQSGPYHYYVNCTTGAFEESRRTQATRKKEFGASHPGVIAWTAAQNVVFSNCSGGENIPAEADPSLPAILRADRAYQIAAAHFYAEHYEEAYARFKVIAANFGSPWSTIAPYLAARCLVRDSTVNDAGKMEQALEEINAILADRRYARYHDAARGLRAFVGVRIRPEWTAQILSKEVQKPGPGARFHQNLIDIEYLFERRFIAKDDLGAWITWMVLRDHGAAVAKWRGGKSQPWLLASLMSAVASDKDVPELLDAAAAVPEKSPAFATALFHRIRLLEETGRRAEAREELDRYMPAIRARFPVAAQNSFLGRRLRVARSLDEFLTFAPRRPVGIVDESPVDMTAPIGEERKPLLDADSRGVLNTGLPLSALQTVSTSKALPAHISNQVLMLAFARAVVLGRHEVAAALAPELAVRKMTIPALLERLQKEATAEEKNFAGVIVLLWSSGFSPEMGISYAYDFRSNWWCKAEATARPAAPPFLTDAERRQLDTEWETMRALEAGPTWLGRKAIAWAKAHPQDPRSPQALHLTVRATRWGCSDGANSAISKEAFSMLHARWPRSEWTAKTPYWF
ncbi:MAG: hypothetical protein U0Q16_24840 [Bryobacteraceae bacterium]